jgi:hypothetical protein
MEIVVIVSCAATILFGFIQLYQWKILFKNKKEMDEIWSQMKTLASTTAKELTKIKIEQENAEKSR